MQTNSGDAGLVVPPSGGRFFGFRLNAGLRTKRAAARRRWSLASLLLVATFPLAAAESSAPNWPQFRGVNSSGLAADARPPVKIGPTEGVLWSVEVPWSPSSPSVWGDRIFLTTFRDGELETRCHDRTDGHLRWARGIKPEGVEEFHRSDGSPAASTPATDGGHVVSYFGSFGLICHDVDGKERWRHPLPLAESMGQYGSGTSPIIVGQRVLLSRDQHRFPSLLAVDLATGKTLWETPRLDIWLQAPPTFVRIGRRCLYLRSDVMAMVLAQRRTSTADPGPGTPSERLAEKPSARQRGSAT